MQRASILITMVMIVISSSCTTKKKKIDCSQFRTGKFEYLNSSKDTRSIIIRNDSIQTERDIHSDTIWKFRINWIDSCKYQLIFISCRSKDRLVRIPPYEYPPYPVVTATIIVAKKNYYVFEAKTGDFTFRDSIFKLE